MTQTPTDSPESWPRNRPHFAAAVPPRLLDHVRHALRVRHYSYRTEEAYVGWIRRFIVFHRKRHPAPHRVQRADLVIDQSHRQRMRANHVAIQTVPPAFPPQNPQAGGRG